MRYPYGPDSFSRPGVPRGTVVEHRLADSQVFPNTSRRFWVYAPAGQDPSEHAVAGDPARRAICGGSSGGSCAFTAAWMRPDRFGRVLSFLGSFAQIPGGNPYPELILQTEPKPLRVFLQAATRDLGWDQPEYNWFSANLRVAASLAERGYDLRLVLGDGGHDPNHAGAIQTDALRWLFRDGPQASLGSR